MQATPIRLQRTGQGRSIADVGGRQLPVVAEHCHGTLPCPQETSRYLQSGPIPAIVRQSGYRRRCSTGDAKRTWRRCKPSGRESGRYCLRSVKVMMSYQDIISERRPPTCFGRKTAGGLFFGTIRGVLVGHHHQRLGFVSLSPAPDELALGPIGLSSHRLARITAKRETTYTDAGSGNAGMGAPTGPLPSPHPMPPAPDVSTNRFRSSAHCSSMLRPTTTIPVSASTTSLTAKFKFGPARRLAFANTLPVLGCNSPKGALRDC